MATLYMYNVYTSAGSAFMIFCGNCIIAKMSRYWNRYISPSFSDIAIVIAILISYVREPEEFLEIFAILTTLEILKVRFQSAEKRSSLELYKFLGFKEISNVWRIYRSSFTNFETF